MVTSILPVYFCWTPVEAYDYYGFTPLIVQL